jgi:DNA-binding NtrC family response regulator
MTNQLGLLNVLIVEDEPVDQRWIRDLITLWDVGSADIVDSGERAEAELRTGRYNCAIIDIDLTDGRYRGMALLERSEFDFVFKIMLTKFGEQMTRSLLHGARRFIQKSEARDDTSRLKLSLYDAALFIQHRLAIYYQSDRMAAFFRSVSVVARLNDPVLITGESGSGKELVAHAIHQISSRAGQPLEAINCACLDPSSAEADLFGVAEDAYTDVAARPGIFERANGGTVFFDEIGEMNLREQARLLRILDNPAELKRSGGSVPVTHNGKPISFRCVFATDKDLGTQVAEGAFNGPLYQRINTQALEVPSLNQRREDIPLLSWVFFRNRGDDVNRLRPEALSLLEASDWKNRNVRGLWSVLAKASVVAETREDSALPAITKADVEEALRLARTPAASVSAIQDRINVGRATLNDVEAAYVERILIQTSGKISEAARILGIGRNTLYDKVRRYDLEHLLAKRLSDR